MALIVYQDSLQLATFSTYAGINLFGLTLLIFRCGRIQVGDRLVSINNCPTENETLDEVKGMLSDAMDNGQVI